MSGVFNYFLGAIITLALHCSYCSEQASIKIEMIRSGIHSENQQVYSLSIAFMATEDVEAGWGFGFYMPRTFRKLISDYQTVNPQLSMHIYDFDHQTSSAPLEVLEREENAQIYSSGYTNIFHIKEGHSFALKKDKRYIITLDNSNQWAPMNYSAMPQSLFFVKDLKSPVFLPIDTTSLNYEIGGYDTNAIEKKIVKHDEELVANSMPIQQTAESKFVQKYALIPAPLQVSPKDGFFVIPERWKVFSKGISPDPTIEAFQDYIVRLERNPVIGKVSNNHLANVEIEKVSAAAFDGHKEGYELEITTKKIHIRAAAHAGVFYGFMTLIQILDQEAVSLPCVKIVDYPRFEYRGVLLDVSRHYFEVHEMKSLLDAMALQKLNTLHVHFSDDEGFRLELESLKEYHNQVSARGFFPGSTNPPYLFGQSNLDITNRKGFSKDHLMLRPAYPNAGTFYDKMYSKEEIIDLIKYANDRHITVIPEVDLPGHAKALVSARESVFFDPSDKSKYISVQGYYKNVVPVCDYLTNQQLRTTLNNMVREINQLFSGQSTLYYQNEVSIGGDEVPEGAWTSCSSCKGKCSSLDALGKAQWFIRALQGQNPRVLLSGWQQAVQRDDGTIDDHIALSGSKAGHIWVWSPSEKGIKEAITLAKEGYPTVLAFADDTYFDLAYSPDKWEPGFTWATEFSDTASALRIGTHASQVCKVLTHEQRKKILGVEGALWSENLYNFRHLSYMALPKMAGLAEAAWSPENQTGDGEGKINWLSLEERLGEVPDGFLPYLSKMTRMVYRPVPKRKATR